MIQLDRRRAADVSGVMVAVGLSAVVIATNVGTILNAFDGGISSSAATFTLHGLLPYRDYWLLYGPLTGFLLAVPTAILGPSIELTRAMGFAVICLGAAFAYGLARVWAGRGPAVALAVSAMVIVPAMNSLDFSSWPSAMTLALAALWLQLGTRRSGVAVGLILGAAFLCRLDVGAYALAGALIVRDRRAVLLGFAVIAIPAIVFAVATTGVDPLVEQLIWYPLVGLRQFRSLPGPEVVLGQPVTTLLEIPLLFLPRLAIGLAIARVGWLRLRRQPEATELALVGLIVFATLCQLQTLGRADLEHFSMAATPALLLFAIWFRDARPSLPRFAALASITSACLMVGVFGNQLHTVGVGYARSVVAAADWVHKATDRDERIFVGLLSHRFTVTDPLIVYYLADRAPAVRDDLFNPGVTNTDWGQARMVADLERTTPPYLVLDRPGAAYSESSNDSRIPGSIRLDTYLAANYHTVCDLGAMVIKGRNGLDRPAPPCPAAP